MFTTDLNDILKKAESKAKGFWIFKNPEFDAAADLFLQAACHYKLRRQWIEASQVHLRAADCYLRGKDTFQYATQLVESAKCLKHDDNAFTANYQRIQSQMEMAIDAYIESGKFTNAANTMKELAEMAEIAKRPEEAKKYYYKSSELYCAENRTEKQLECLINEADISFFELHYYADAMRKYERAIDLYLGRKTTLGKYGCIEYCFKACLCLSALIAGNGDRDQAITTSRNLLDHYEYYCPQFNQSCEQKLCLKILEAYETYDDILFDDYVLSFENAKSSPTWLHEVLLIIRNGICSTPDLS